ncbi:MAG: alpha/beta hydrolase [Bacteroides sp.]|nr:alpha/beta hydrolase [Roseburia sp.]MCM1345829.1 alpha/beta hydrolase [Bacteroides sp.]MCM1420219.1 alpha/beta hydrolase [Bacteroides sp.]
MKLKTILITAVSAIYFGTALHAQNNPWGLVYEQAITENVPGKVNITPVKYNLDGIEIAANVYTPAGYNPLEKQYPAIIVAHPNGGTKEQVAGLFAQRMAEKGYVTIAADASYQGASGGEPRHTDRPANRINDIHGMADYISKYPGVNPKRIGAFGICGGGGYTLGAAQNDKRFKAAATLSMFNSGRVRRNGFMDSAVTTIQQRLKQASDAREKRIETGEIVFTGDMNLTDEEIEKLPFDLYREGAIYYNRTHAHPNSTFRYTMESLMDLMTWDATDHIDLINVPLLMMAGNKADTFYMTSDAFEKATGTTDKELFLIPGATHIKTYYEPEFVEQEVAKLTEFFGKKL